MTVHINVLSAKATFNFTGNKPAISGLNSAEVVDTDGGHEKPRHQSWFDPNKTLVDEHDDVSAVKTINWLAGVGDICNGTTTEIGEGDSISQSYDSKRGSSTWLSSGSEMKRGSRLLTHCRTQDKPDTRRSALRRHCDFWDADQDGVIYPWDIFVGFRKLGFNIALCLWAAVTMAFCSSYSTQRSFLPHPFFAIYLDNVNRNRHGSTTGAYDLDAELDTRRFDAIFEKYAGGKDYLTWRTMYDVWAGQCCANDFFGWFAGGLECKS
jgi:hypothetical protein